MTTTIELVVDRLDHLVLTVRDIDATIAFYEGALGMHALTFGNGRRALGFGNSKINLHSADTPFDPHAARPVPGSADLCFVTTTRFAHFVAFALKSPRRDRAEFGVVIHQ